MHPGRLARAVCALLVAVLLVLTPVAAFGLSVSWESVSDAPGILDEPHYVWPYVVWSNIFDGTHLLDLRDGTITTEATTGTPQPFLSEEMVGWWNGAAWNVRFLASGETTQLPATISYENELLASGTRIVQFHFSPVVYDCVSGSIVTTFGPGNVDRAAIDGTRLAWSTPQGNGRALKIWDFVQDTSSIVATSPQIITAVAIEGDRVVYATPTIGTEAAVYLVDLSTGDVSTLCTTRSWPTQMRLCGDYVYFDGYGVSVFNLRTGELSKAAIALSGYVYWDAWRDHTIANQSGYLLFGTADIAPPTTVSDADDNYVAEATVRLAALDDVSPPEECRTFWRLDGGAAIESTTTATSESGDHTLEYWSRDEMGNEEPHQRVSFTVEPGYTITATAGLHGSISNPGVTAYQGGDDCTYTITPAAGYHISNVTVDGTSVGAVTTHAFRDLSSNHTISATFAANLPKASVGTPVAPSTMYRNRAATIYGYVAPRHATGTYLVTLKFYLRNSSGAYVYHHSVRAKRYYYSSSKTKYKAYTSLPHKGKWRVRASHSCASHAENSSGYDYVTVK